MNLNVLSNISETEASNLLQLTMGRLRKNGGLIGVSLFEVLEVPIPDGMSTIDFERVALGGACKTVGESYSG